MIASDHPAEGAPAFLADGGVCGALALSVDWAKTPLGPIETWPPSLRTAVDIVLHSRHPMFLWWGPELVQVYNDAYLPSFGRGKHPAAMGQRGRDCWPEIWPIIWPQIDDVMSRARPSWNEDQLVPIYRNGKIEEVYWTYGYSAVHQEDGEVGGTLVVCTETTRRVLAERRQASLRRLIEHTARADSASALMASAHDMLTSAAIDIPFSLIYEAPQGVDSMRLVSCTGLTAPTLSEVDGQVRASLTESMPARGAFDAVPYQASSPEVSLPGGPWDEPSSEFVIAPISGSSHDNVAGFVVFGVSSRLPLDQSYRDFFSQIVEHISLAYARVEAARIRSAAEHERRNLLLQAPVATALLLGPEHVFELANPLYCQLVGRHDLVGKAYRDAFPELASTDLPSLLDRVYATGEPYVTHEYPATIDVLGTGVPEERIFQFNLEPMRSTDGAVYGMMAVAVDVTDQVRARRVLEKAHAEHERLLAELETASRAKDAFLAMLGHELRNPLAPIVTALQLMRMRGDTQAEKEHAIIERHITHVVRLVDDLLDVSKITRGKIVLRKEAIEIADVANKALEMSSILLDERQQTLTMDIERRGLSVHGDPVRLAQVLSNLLTNAARYTERGGKIWISAAREKEEILIRVRDSGTGISPDLLPHIFDLFVQGKRSPDRSEGGLGIGLTLVKGFVQLHGGSVTASSEGLGKGTEFVVRLPAFDGAIDAERVPAPDSSWDFSASVETKRILVVDDNEDAAELLGAALSAAGHEVQVAMDPLAAIARARTFAPHIALLDIGLPVMDGYELGAQLHGAPETSECRLIALTGYGQDHDRSRSQNAGFVRHLVKPINIGELLRVISEQTDLEESY